MIITLIKITDNDVLMKNYMSILVCGGTPFLYKDNIDHDGNFTDALIVFTNKCRVLQNIGDSIHFLKFGTTDDVEYIEELKEYVDCNGIETECNISLDYQITHKLF